MQRLSPRIIARVQTRYPFPHFTRYNHTNYEVKYAEKLQERARTQGVGIEELKRKVKEAAKEQGRRIHEQTTPQTKSSMKASIIPESHDGHALPAVAQKERKDSSPVKPLSSILNISRIFATPHTAEQISALWNAYHLSHSRGTGRGFLCASIPLDAYQKMAGVATKYPSFVVPVPRPRTNTEAQQNDEDGSAYEFYYLQWDFHGVPSAPPAADDLFTLPKTSTNPPISTILFTPLQEYKSRVSFATPYLVLTHYTDLATTHGLVLLRGEITQSSNHSGSGAGSRYMLGQNDAQLLSMVVQKFYLWDTGDETQNEGGALLKRFHEQSEQFRWEDLLRHSSLGI